MNDLVTDGALHEHEVELVFIIVQRVLLPCLFTHHTHGGVGQDGLHGLRRTRKVGFKVVDILRCVYSFRMETDDQANLQLTC